MKKHRGIFLIDAIVGLMILGIAAGVLAVGTNRHQSAVLHLAHHRAAARLAENGITRLQTGRPLPQPIDPQNKIYWRKLDTPAPAGMIWAKVDASVEGQSESLVGIIPQSATGAQP